MKRHFSVVGILFSQLVKDEQGGEVIEYALTLGLVAAACVLMVQTIGAKFYDIWERIDRALAMIG